MTKAKQIEAKLAEPIKVGDSVMIRIPYVKKTSTGSGKKYKEIHTDAVHTSGGTVREIIDNPIHGIIYNIETHSTSVPSDARLPSSDFKNIFTSHLYKAEWVRQDTDNCGVNPMKPKIRVNFIAQAIDSLMYKGDYNRRSDNFLVPEYNKITGGHKDDEQYIGMTHGGINFNPHIIDINGNKVFYQRDLVWTTEQKQLLIHSVYNGIEIGKFIFKYNSWANIQKQLKETGHGFDFDCVDGKQRYHALLEFFQNKFPDEFGNYWRDLSPRAQREFLNYNNLAIGEMDEKATAKDIIATFLTLNFTGAPMSREHIEHVKSIKV